MVYFSDRYDNKTPRNTYADTRVVHGRGDVHDSDAVIWFRPALPKEDIATRSPRFERAVAMASNEGWLVEVRNCPAKTALKKIMENVNKQHLRGTIMEDFPNFTAELPKGKKANDLAFGDITVIYKDGKPYGTFVLDFEKELELTLEMEMEGDHPSAAIAPATRRMPIEIETPERHDEHEITF